MNKDLLKAWLWAIFSVTVLWGLGNVSLSYASKILHANAIVYTCSIFMGSAFGLLLYAGKGDLGKQTLRSIDTWAYGLVLIIGYVVSYGMYSLSTATEAALLDRFSIIAGIMASWLFLDRKPNLKQIIGCILIICGAIVIANGLKDDIKGAMYSLTFLFALLYAARAMLAETHKTHKYASDNRSDKDKVRVVGYIMFIVAALFLFFALVFSLIEYSTGSEVSSIIPSLKEFTNPSSIFMGLIVGMVVIAPIRLIEFTTATKIKSENYLALASLAPFSILFIEWISAPITGLSIKEFTQTDALAGVIILAGGLVIAFSKAKSQVNNDVNEYIAVSLHDMQAVEDSKDIIGKTLAHTNNNLNDVSKVLELPLNVIEYILSEDTISLRKDTLIKTERIYRTKISSKDSLTGLLNRTGLLQELEALKEKKKRYTLFYIDLNKFKPINDKFGHASGDEALKQIARKLLSIKYAKYVARIGGDEFIVALQKNINEEVFEKTLHDKIEELFTLSSVNMVVGLSASIGFVKSEDYKDLEIEQLLDYADKMMLKLKDKSER